MKTCKRMLDIVVAAIAFFLLSPCFALIILAVYVKMGWPPFFCQIRPVCQGGSFTILKFRTMRDEQDEEGNPLPDEQRLTRLGRVLRSTSLDELPELWNVLKGDMSIVGPRPLLMQYVKRYTPEQARRHEVKPGLTGWAQVNGRNALSWEEKFAMDVWYVDHWSLKLDLKIIGMTILKVLKSEGISAEGEATMPEFNPQITQMDAD